MGSHYVHIHYVLSLCKSNWSDDVSISAETCRQLYLNEIYVISCVLLCIFTHWQVFNHISEEPVTTIIRICKNGSWFAVESVNGCTEIMTIWFWDNVVRFKVVTPMKVKIEILLMFDTL
jgi:hypothetical protein